MHYLKQILLRSRGRVGGKIRFVSLPLIRKRQDVRLYNKMIQLRNELLSIWKLLQPGSKKAAYTTENSGM